MVIDFHYHYIDKENNIDELLEQMRQASVDMTLMCAIEGLSWFNTTVGTNARVYEAVKRFPDRITGCIYIDPRWPDAYDIIDEYADKGFKCVKMWPPVGFNPDEDRYFGVYEKIAKRGLPILFHAGQTASNLVCTENRRSTDSFCAYPMRFDKVARAFPEIPIILAHMGYPNYIETWSVAQANPNIYLDVAGGGPWIEGIPLVYSAIGKFIPIDFKRVLWGSDNCMQQKDSIEFAKNSLKQMGCEESDFEFIFGETARRLLKI